MRSLIFLIITLISGAIAGTVLALINLGVVEPYIDKAIAIETQNKISSGENVNLNELIDYRMWQKGGAVAAGAIYGIALSALFGIVFAYSQNYLPGSNYKKKAILLAGILWFVLYFMVAIKYPANPPAVGDPETIYYREGLYVAYICISGFSALVLAIAWKKLKSTKKNIIIPLLYALIMTAAYIALPPNPDNISISMDLIQTFRVLTAVTIGIFWGILGILFGLMWDKYLRSEPQWRAQIR
jgi:predicted cobalt transporter CbtA